MKCQSCGAEIKKDSTFCEYCGSQISLEMKKEQEQLDRTGCPKCGSTNIEFKREKQGEVKGKKGMAVVRSTVGVCKDCGNTWSTTEEKKKNNLIWWILGWIFFFPAPVMVLIWRKKCTWNTKVKVIVTVVFWLFIFIVGSVNNSGEQKVEEQPVVEETVEESVNAEEQETTESEINAETQETVEVESVENNEEIEEPEIEFEKEDAEEKEEESLTMGQKNALASAHSYLSFTAFSAKGLKEQLEFDGYTSDEAQYAVDNCGADWNEQAALSAQSYLEFTSFSASGLKDQLEFDGYTSEQAEYGVKAVGY